MHMAHSNKSISICRNLVARLCLKNCERSGQSLREERLISQRSAETRGFSPGTPIPPTGKVDWLGYVIRAHSNWLTLLW